MAVHITSFGFDHGPAPHADHVEDVRNVAYHPKDWKAHGKAIASRVKAGKAIKTVAIGDKHGHERAPHIAKHVQSHLKGATLSHRDRAKGLKHMAHLKTVKRGEKIRTLRGNGIPEADAIRQTADE